MLRRPCLAPTSCLYQATVLERENAIIWVVKGKTERHRHAAWVDVMSSEFEIFGTGVTEGMQGRVNRRP